MADGSQDFLKHWMTGRVIRKGLRKLIPRITQTIAFWTRERRGQGDFQFEWPPPPHCLCRNFFAGTWLFRSLPSSLHDFFLILSPCMILFWLHPPPPPSLFWWSVRPQGNTEQKLWVGPCRFNNNLVDHGIVQWLSQLPWDFILHTTSSRKHPFLFRIECVSRWKKGLQCDVASCSVIDWRLQFYSEF